MSELTQDEELPLVSIRMAAYNHERYVEAALDSTLVADYPNKELVIVDDGSTDATPDIIRDWIARHEDEIPITFASHENQGLAATLNELCRLSRGEFLVPLASDDVLHPNAIYPRVRYLQAHPEKLAVIGDALIIDAEGKQTGKSVFDEISRVNRETYQTDAGIRRHIILGAPPPGPCMACRTALYDVIGPYDEKLRVIDDWDFYLRMVAKNLVGITYDTVGIYRIHGRNMSLNPHSRGKIKLDMMRTVRRNYHRFHGYERWLLLRRLYSLSTSYLRHDLPDRLFSSLRGSGAEERG